MKTKSKLCQCPYDDAIQCDMSDPCSGCEDFTGEGILQDKQCECDDIKPFKVGEYYKHRNHSGVIEATGLSDGGNNISGILVEKGSCSYDVGYKGHQWGMKYLTHIPNYKKEFKVGDWAEAYHYSSGELYIGEIEDIDECYGIRDVSGRYHACKKSTAKHTTKPKEQPLKYKEWDVKIGCGQVIQIGCKSFDRSELQTALRVMNTVNEHSDVNAFRTWLDSNQEKLGL